MGFLKRLGDLFSSKPQGDRYAYWVTVKCKRCGEIIRTRVDMRNDLSPSYDEEEGKMSYYCRKVLMGENRCFQKVEVELRFDANHKLTNRQVSGGEFVEEP